MLKNKVSRVIALVATVCCLGGAAAGLTAFAVNSSISAKAVDTAYSNQEPVQQYVIRFREPEGVTFALDDWGDYTFAKYLLPDNSSNVSTDLKEAYGISDIKKYESDSSFTSEKGTVYDVAFDDAAFKAKSSRLSLYYSFDDTVESVSISGEAGGVTGRFQMSSSGYYQISIADWADGTTNNHLPVVTATAVYKKVTYAVTHTNPQNFYFTGNNAATAGENYNFTVVPHNGFSITSVKYTVNSGNEKDAVGSNGSYVIPAAEVTGVINITVTVEVKKYTVTFNNPTGAYFAQKGSGENYERIDAPLSLSTAESIDMTFRLVADEGYTVENAKVYQGGALLSGSGDETYKEYTLQSVSVDVAVSAMGVTRKTYTVQKAAGVESGFEITGLPSRPVEHGSSVTFTVNVTDPSKEIEKVTYTMGEGDSNTLTSSNNTYTILNVTGDVTITVTLKDKTYTLTLTAAAGSYFAEDNSGITHIGTVTATHGQSTTLYLFAEPHYDVSKATLVLGGATGDPISGLTGTTEDGKEYISFTIDSNKITANTAVSVRGVAQKTYTVTLKYDGVTGYDVRSLSATAGLHNGNTYQFTVTAKPGFSNNGYTVSASNTDAPEKSVTITPAAPEDTSTNTFALTVNGDITVTVAQKDDAIQKYTVSLADSDGKYTIKVDGAALGDGNNQVEYGKEFSFTVEANEGYTVTGVYAGDNSVPFRNGQYTITVTGNVTLHVTVQENTLTVTYMLSSGEQGGVETYNYTTLTEGKDVPSTDSYALGGTFTYLLASWYKDGKPYTDKQFNKNLIAKANASITLNCRYVFNAEKSDELFTSFTAKYRDDNEGADGWNKEKSYLIVKLAIDSENWQVFLNELNALGASLTAVGFTYSNAPQGILGYTNEDISNKIAGMTLATGNEIGKADEKTGNNGAVSRLYGYRWDKAGVTQENQVQFISGINANAMRYVGGWFAVTINGVRTVIQSNLEKVAGTPAAKKAAVEAVLTESAPMYESDEEPTVE